MIILLVLLLSFQASAYVISKGNSGESLKWIKQDSRIPLYIDPNVIGNNASGISSLDVQTIFNESISEWNAYSPFQLVPFYTTSQTGANQVEFTDNPIYFDSGVLAITEVNFNSSTGVISSADIYFNESLNNYISFTDDETESSHLKAYLGDVFTHELGHLLGLSHSEVIGSSMVFSVFKNQHTLHSDDIHGIWDNYNVTQAPGEIYGSVLGGQAVPVFGANVFLINSVTMEVEQAQLTDESGKFHFKNVDKTKSYLIYSAPLKLLDSVSEYYSTIISTYCTGGNDYQTSFFTDCGARSASRPQGIQFGDESSLDVGEITIRCSEKLSPEYLSLKQETSEREFQLVDSFRKTAFVFNGYFSSDEINDGLTGQGDEFDIDLRYLDVENIHDYVLKVNTVTNGIGSALGVDLFIKRVDEAGYTLYQSSTDETGKRLTDQELYLPLSSVTSNNQFSIKVFPRVLTSSETYEIFSVFNKLSNSRSHYLLSAQLGDYHSGAFEPLNLYGSEYFDDNASCLEGEITFTSEAYEPLASSAAQLGVDDEAGLGVSCGTVDINSDGPGSGGAGVSFIFGLLLFMGMKILGFRLNLVR
ncbi:MAG: hypothetical protein CME62_02570 [Halobacteriovoraceae bacterium]|nr:hypothetical protein [Halobacteriovoraceae bacterium]|tara:strand:+ start:2678 stop:4441 length:1764 start_codon:yes stop_codon:yes gene_type:complete